VNADITRKQLRKQGQEIITSYKTVLASTSENKAETDNCSESEAGNKSQMRVCSQYVKFDFR